MSKNTRSQTTPTIKVSASLLNNINLSNSSDTEQWREPVDIPFFKSEKENTTILFGGLSDMHDQLLEAGLISLGYKAKALKCPDKAALQAGKEFGNRGQCNPTYFTVGNLVKHLLTLRDTENIPSEDIVKNYVFLTAGGCGPCRFGMYNTEYRKSLADAGFPGFRTLTFQQQPESSTSDAGATHNQCLDLNNKFYLRIIRIVMIADVINLMGYRIRPYEIDTGDTDSVMTKCKDLVHDAIVSNSSITTALKKCKNLFSQIQTNKLQVKTKVSIIGEFWAMTTEGEGNYHLQRFLESEGAECDIQPISNWILYTLWSIERDSNSRSIIEKNLLNRAGLNSTNQIKVRLLIKAAKLFLKGSFYKYAKLIGLDHYRLSDMDKIAALANKHYYTELRGGEGHMEVGKLIYNFAAQKSHLVISVKPFGCMPSSGVSDGVQSLIVKQYPNINFLPIETSGDGAVNVYSRIQMALFKARQNAQNEFEQALKDRGINSKQIEQLATKHKKINVGTYYPKHRTAGSASNIIYSL